MNVSLTEDPIPFPLFNEKFFKDYEKDQKLIGHLNQEMLHLNHKCSYKWQNQIRQQWSFENEIKLLVITWNMHGMIPGYSLKRLFNIETVQHDLIVIGTQECQRSIAISLLCESKDSWEAKLREEFGKNFVKVHSTSLNAMHLIVFVREALVPRIKNPKSYTLSQGFMGIVGNKGGIGISVSVNEKIFLFANSHLESGQNAEPKRQSQFSQLESTFQNQVFSSHKNVPYDYVIWTGDFNSRINDKITTNTIKSHSDFFSWLGKDQMYQSRINKLNYQSEFKEGMIFFPPTYKLLENMNQWAVGNDFRIPGWCDRILFKENRMMSSKKSSTSNSLDDHQTWTIQLQNYDANFDVLGSDHRPVFAQFSVSF